MSLHELKDDKSEEKWENGEKSSKRCDRKVVEKHRHTVMPKNVSDGPILVLN